MGDSSFWHLNRSANYVIGDYMFIPRKLVISDMLCHIIFTARIATTSCFPFLTSILCYKRNNYLGIVFQSSFSEMLNFALLKIILLIEFQRVNHFQTISILMLTFSDESELHRFMFFLREIKYIQYNFSWFFSKISTGA